MISTFNPNQSCYHLLLSNAIKLSILQHVSLKKPIVSSRLIAFIFTLLQLNDDEAPWLHLKNLPQSAHIKEISASPAEPNLFLRCTSTMHTCKLKLTQVCNWNGRFTAFLHMPTIPRFVLMTMDFCRFATTNKSSRVPNHNYAISVEIRRSACGSSSSLPRKL